MPQPLVAEEEECVVLHYGPPTDAPKLLRGTDLAGLMDSNRRHIIEEIPGIRTLFEYIQKLRRGTGSCRARRDIHNRTRIPSVLGPESGVIHLNSLTLLIDGWNSDLIVAHVVEVDPFTIEIVVSSRFPAVLNANEP